MRFRRWLFWNLPTNKTKKKNKFTRAIIQLGLPIPITNWSLRKPIVAWVLYKRECFAIIIHFFFRLKFWNMCWFDNFEINFLKFFFIFLLLGIEFGPCLFCFCCVLVKSGNGEYDDWYRWRLHAGPSSSFADLSKEPSGSTWSIEPTKSAATAFQSRHEFEWQQ